MRKNWIAAEEVSEEVVDVELMEVPSETIESDLVEITGLDKDIESLVADGEELEHDTDSVEALADNVEASLEEDGMDETAARATEIAAESFSNKWGIARKRIGAEAFGEVDSRRQATRLAHEGLKDTISEMWETFIKWIKELIAKGREQLAKLVNAGKSLRKRAESLEAKLDKGLGEAKKSGAKLTGGFTTNLVVDEKVDFAFCLAAAADSDKTAAFLGKNVLVELDGTTKLIRKGGKAEAPAAGTASATEVLGGSFGKKTTKKLSVPSGSTSQSIAALPGNGYLLTYMHNGLVHVKYEVSGEKAKDRKVEPLGEKEMREGIAALFSLSDVLEKRMTSFQDANTAMEKLTDAVSSAKSELKDAEGEAKKDARTNLAKARATVNNTKAKERALTTSLKNIGTGVSGYVAASLSSYKSA